MSSFERRRHAPYWTGSKRRLPESLFGGPGEDILDCGGGNDTFDAGGDPGDTVINCN